MRAQPEAALRPWASGPVSAPRTAWCVGSSGRRRDLRAPSPARVGHPPVPPSHEGEPAVRDGGGGWVNEIRQQHWRLIARIARDTSQRVVVPIYPLLPFGTARDAAVTALDLTWKNPQIDVVQPSDPWLGPLSCRPRPGSGEGASWSRACAPSPTGADPRRGCPPGRAAVPPEVPLRRRRARGRMMG